VLEQFEKRDFPDPGDLGRQELPMYLVLRGGIQVGRGWVEWCDEAISAMRTLTEKS
jgi:hypothetical protein